MYLKVQPCGLQNVCMEESEGWSHEIGDSGRGCGVRWPGAAGSVDTDPAFSAVIHDKLQVPNTIRKSWNDRDNRCDICATHLNQLKQEAIQMVLTLEQAAGSEHYDASLGSPPPISSIPTLVGSRHVGGLQQPREWAFVPAPYATSTYTGLVNKHSGKPNSLGVSNGAEKKGGSPTHQAKVSLQMATSPSNGNILNSVAIQAHQYLDGTWSLSRTNGVTLYPYQISQLMTETGREGLTESALNRYNADKPAASSVPASQASCVASETSTGTSVAASFFARAGMKKCKVLGGHELDDPETQETYRSVATARQHVNNLPVMNRHL
ncbi:kinesin-like protein KIF26B [Cricetulus griseus]|nr:kinesin-like protein KIF26B [Cricetulus griseus]